MKTNTIFEAFSELNALTEDVFSVDVDGITDLSDFMNNDTDNKISIIDANAETVDDLQDSYIGNVICECSVCHSLIYKKPEEVVIDDETDLANVDEECPYCSTVDGFKIVGQVAEYKPEAEVETESNEDAEIKVDDKEVKDEDDEADEKDDDEDENLKESFENVHVDLDDAEITIKSKEADMNDVGIDAGEMIAPMQDDLKADIEANEPEEEDVPEDEEDVDISEFDEKEFDKLGESYLKNIYENVNRFKTTSVKTDKDSLIVEGLIKFNSGRIKHTKFTFMPESMNKKTNKVKFLGENLDMSKSKKAYALIGNLSNGKLIAESLRYNYMAKNAVGKSTRCSGVVSQK